MFVIDSEFSSDEEIFEELFEPETILLYTEQAQYSGGKTIVVTRLVSSVDSPTVLIGIYDPFGLPAGFYFGTINSDLEFSTNFLVKSGVNFRIEGTYSAKDHYGEPATTSFFDYYENIPDTTTDNIPDTTIIEQPTVYNESSTSDSEKPEVTEIFSDSVGSEKSNPSKTNSDEQILNNKHLENKKQNNLSVEDIELGKILNQINLECDDSKFTDTITYYDGMGPALYRLCNFESSLIFLMIL
ncbi:MAG: hypothetical protein LVO36_01685 [Nitrosopumilus sp. (ex Thoosa mismalolli)]|nr:hypothetical protein [Nitrosopumilus sp. (ex Thoosa mismalolli)]